jgi:tRNA nucleotidyltransferase (CCA-adding enzyme)
MRIVTTHKNMDFDALASMIAATILYPDAVPVLPKPINPNVKEFLALHKDMLNVQTWKEVDHSSVSQLIVVDANCWDRLSIPKGVRNNRDMEVLLYDHHMHGENIDTKWKCQEEMGATITLMVRYIKEEKKALTPIQSTLFLAGLYEDTGSLTFPSSKPEDAYAAAYLLENDADLNLINLMLRPVYGQKQKNILFDMLQKGCRKKLNGFNVSLSKVSIEGFVENLAVVVHMYREIMNADAAFGLFAAKERDNCIVIGRSNHDDINIGSIMRSIGGGGHPAAGSAMVKAKSLDAVEELIQELIVGNQKASIQISDLMSFPVESIHEKVTMETAARLLREKGCTGVPITNAHGHLVGVISRRDFQKKIKKETQLKAPVKAFMSTDVVTISPGKSPTDASRLMVKHDIGRLPVVENDMIIGIITRSDIMLYYYDMMPD